MNKLNIPVILGTARAERRSEKVANFVLDEARKFGFNSELVDVRDHLYGHTKRNHPAEWAEIVKRSDALIIVSPEYNHGYPGELKILLDSLFEEYEGKPVGICGVSIGPIGGARMFVQLAVTCLELRLLPMHPPVLFGYAAELFDEQGKIKDNSYVERLTAMFEKIKREANLRQP